MKTSNKRFMFLPFWVIISVFIIAACSTEKMDDLEADVQLKRENMELDEEFDLKQGHAAQNRLLAQIRRATAKYHDLDAAVVDGYRLDAHCVEHPEFGAMGQHAVNMGRIGPFVNPSEPGVLVYEPKEDGTYELVAAEYLVPAEPWDAMNDGPPMMGNVPFDDHREIIFVPDLDDDGNPQFDDEGNLKLKPINAKGGPAFPHYQLHVWVWRSNPLGMYFPFNPKVSCEPAHH